MDQVAHSTITLADGFAVDATEYASRANAILGIRDSGKTYTGTKVAEQLLLAGVPVFAFDPIGRWRFLRMPGKGGRGFQVVVAGGAAPDLDLTPESAPKIVRAAMQTGMSVVFDLYSVHLSKGDWRKIVRGAIETILYEGEGHGLRHVFLEEAAEFIPQHVRDGMTYAAVEKLARMGGNVGVGITLINQRAEEVNKAVLELCDNLLLHRQRGKNSLLSLRKWLAAGNVDPPKEITDTLADLPTGQCWAWFKDVGKPKLIKVGVKLSFDPNRRAMSKVKGAAPAAIDVRAFVDRMKAALAGKKIEPVVGLPKIAEKIIAERAAPANRKQEDKTVKESEARALRAENDALKNQVADLTRRLGAATNAPGAAAVPVDADGLYAEFKRRLIADGDPAVLRLLSTRPEIEVAVQRRTVQVEESTLKGRIAKLLAGGFYDEGATNSGTRSELKRTGADSNNANIGRVLDGLKADGFLTQDGDRFKAVAGMKINIVEA